MFLSVSRLQITAVTQGLPLMCFFQSKKERGEIVMVFRVARWKTILRDKSIGRSRIRFVFPGGIG